jgi:hypothetical protein
LPARDGSWIEVQDVAEGKNGRRGGVGEVNSPDNAGSAAAAIDQAKPLSLSDIKSRYAYGARDKMQLRALGSKLRPYGQCNFPDIVGSLVVVTRYEVFLVYHNAVLVSEDFTGENAVPVK